MTDTWLSSHAQEHHRHLWDSLKERGEMSMVHQHQQYTETGCDILPELVTTGQKKKKEEDEEDKS